MLSVLDDLACLTLDEHGVRTPVDTVDLALRMGLVVRRVPIDTACTVGDVVLVSESVLPQRAHGLVAHELGHVLLKRARLPNTEENADYLGAALLVPAPALMGDLREVGVDLPELRRRHPNASSTLLTLRVAEMRRGRVSVWEKDALAWSRGYGPRGPERVRSLVRDAWRLGEPRGWGDGVVEPLARAWPLDHGWSVALETPPLSA